MGFTLPSAEAYLKQKLASFYRESGTLKDALIRAGQTVKRAETVGKPELIADAKAVQNRFRSALSDQLTWERRLMPIAEWFGIKTGLGALPVVVAAIAIPAAIFLTNHFAKLTILYKELGLIERGVLTAEQAEKLKPEGILTGAAGVLGNLQNVGLMVLIGLGALWLFRAGSER